MRRNGTATGSPKGVPVTTRRSDTEFRREISQSDIHADAMRRLQANPAVQEEAAMKNWTNPTEEARKAAHTPAPWTWFTKLNGDGMVQERDGRRMKHLVGADGQGFACTVGLSPETDAANADLMISAPTLLADNARLRDDLQGVLDWYAGLPEPGLVPNPVELDARLREARATLAATKPHGGAS